MHIVVYSDSEQLLKFVSTDYLSSEQRRPSMQILNSKFHI